MNGRAQLDIPREAWGFGSDVGMVAIQVSANVNNPRANGIHEILRKVGVGCATSLPESALCQNCGILYTHDNSPLSSRFSSVG